MEIPFYIHSESTIPSNINKSIGGKNENSKLQKPRRALGDLSSSTINVRAQAPSASFGKTQSRDIDGITKGIFKEKQPIGISSISLEQNKSIAIFPDEEMVATRFVDEEDPYDRMIRQSKLIKTEILPGKVKTKPLQSTFNHFDGLSFGGIYGDEVSFTSSREVAWAASSAVHDELDSSSSGLPFSCPDLNDVLGWDGDGV